MVQRARDMLWLNRSRVNRTTTGDTRPGRDLWVYGRGGRACRRCGTLIESDRGGDRVSLLVPGLPDLTFSARATGSGAQRSGSASLTILRTTVANCLGSGPLL